MYMTLISLQIFAYEKATVSLLAIVPRYSVDTWTATGAGSAAHAPTRSTEWTHTNPVPYEYDMT